MPGYSQVTIFPKCATCHASTKTTDAERHGALKGINFDTYTAAKASAQLAVEMVQNDAMPPSNAGVTVTDAEKATLYQWARCGTPE